MTKLEQKLADQILKEALILSKSDTEYDKNRRGALIVSYNELVSAAVHRSNIVPTESAPIA